MNRLLNDFILAHEADSPAELMLHRERWPDIDMTEAVKCIQGRVKARSKLPLWYAEPGLVYPQSLSLEQCSSQATALYKQRFVNSGDRVADLTGGLGVDSWSISQAAVSVDYFERSEELCDCARHNFSVLGRDNIKVRREETTPEMLGSIPSDSYSLIYLDPARRGKDGSRVYSLRDCEPDITALCPELLRIAPRILLKASPMADIRVLLSELPEAAEVRIVSHNNECKEVLPLQKIFLLPQWKSSMTVPRRQLNSISPYARKWRSPQTLPPHRKSPASFTSHPPPCSKAEHSNSRPSASAFGRYPPPPTTMSGTQSLTVSLVKYAASSRSCPSTRPLSAISGRNTRPAPSLPATFP